MAGLNRIAKWGSWGARQETGIALGLLLLVAILAFYNLKYNPRSWTDEGAALSLSKTLAQEGVYAVRSSEGYQAFGPAQSVGPTVLLPVALSFKLFGIGLVQGRIVAASYTLLVLGIFLKCGRELFGWPAAAVSAIFLLGSPTVGFLLFGRQVLGEVPALGFFLAGWLAWAQGVRTDRAWLYPIAGLLMGAAMITKTQYMVIVFGTLVLIAALDLFYFRQRNLGKLILVGLIAMACVAAWWGWQIIYFGAETFQENAVKLRQLANSTMGFRLSTTIEALKLLFGSSGPLYFFWIVPALLYAAFLCLGRDRNSFVLAFLLIFSCLWLGYFIFWIEPWPQYALAPLAVASLFIGKLYYDLVTGFTASWRSLWQEIGRARLAAPSLSPQALVSLGTLVALITMSLLVVNQLLKTIRTDVLDQVGEQATYFRILQLQSPHQAAAFLDKTVEKGAVIETWERELDILSDHRYHFPDQSMLARVHAREPQNYALGADYFGAVKPSYVVIGWYARAARLYDSDFIAKYGDLVATIGQDEWRYDVYKLHLP